MRLQKGIIPNFEQTAFYSLFNNLRSGMAEKAGSNPVCRVQSVPNQTTNEGIGLALASHIAIKIVMRDQIAGSYSDWEAARENSIYPNLLNF
jgi:hypothetical protein